MLPKWKLDMIVWDITVTEYGYNSTQELKNNSKVILTCSDCKLPTVRTTIVSMRIKKDKKQTGNKYTPICKSCQQKRTWANTEYRNKQSKKQSEAMKKTWENTAYRKNQSEKHKKTTKKKWLDKGYREKVVRGVTEAHKNIPGYTHTAVSAMAGCADKRIQAIRKKYQTDATYKTKLSDSIKKWWANPETIAKFKKICANPAFREKLSRNAKKLWQDKAYVETILAILRSEERRESNSTAVKRAWQNPELRSKMIRSLLDQDIREKALESFLNKLDQGLRDQLSEQSKRLWENPEYRESVIIGNKLLWTEKRRQDIAETMRLLAIKFWSNPNAGDVYRTPEHRRLLSQQSKKLWENPEYRQKMEEIYATPEYREKLSRNAKKLWQDAEYVAKIVNNTNSRLEELLADTLDDLQIDYVRQFHIGYWPFDFMIPCDGKDILLEVHGNYWHGTKHDYNRARDKAKATYIDRYCSDQYDLHVIWENEFLTPQRIIDKLSVILGITKLDNHNFAFADCKVKLINAAEANVFYSKYHYTASGGRNGINIGVYLGDMLIACSKYCNPTRAESATKLGFKQSEVSELTRFAIATGYNKKNFASWCLSRSVKFVSSKKCLLTFADTTFGHVGTIYRACGWTFDGVVAPDYFYIDKDGFVMHKRTLWGHAKKMKMTESEYCNMYGYTKKYGKEKHRYIKLNP